MTTSVNKKERKKNKIRRRKKKKKKKKMRTVNKEIKTEFHEKGEKVRM
jgi:hypothetical protein